MRVDLKLVADVATCAGGDIHNVREIICQYDNWLVLARLKPENTEYLEKAEFCEKLLRAYYYRKKSGEGISIFELRKILKPV